MMNNENTILEQSVRNIFSHIKCPFDKYYARECVTISAEQHTVLACLRKQSKMTHHTLCELTNKDKPSITRLLDRLEMKHLVQRVADPNDKRKKYIHITNQGVMECEKISRIRESIMQHAMRNINETELVTFNIVLQNIMDNLALV
ncbi:MarR family transcriptional regulator [Paludibacter sp.]|uniref:MarR family winged helix-turn-helix transcriptional regulator n=1 Tax=Paludibacter sp. TaxID=1898105 RepID=UPI0013533EB7|nr:MarR family transcriptional regulator [Paludibacter sp.]MTK52983.1 MarR family transcriptional regulator [Paludibacter sp.]